MRGWPTRALPPLAIAAAAHDDLALASAKLSYVRLFICQNHLCHPLQVAVAAAGVLPAAQAVTACMWALFPSE